MSLVLLSLVTLCWGPAHPEPMTQCGSEVGPSPEWLVQHALIPGDLKSLQVELVKSSVAAEDQTILMKISWILRADASILSLKATKICVAGFKKFQSYSCVRCNYTEAFQTQIKPSGDRWMFSYIGFPIEPGATYYIGAHNIPSGKLNGDIPFKLVNFTSPGCLDHTMKYQKKCISDGSLWDPNMTACKKNKTVVEVNFTTNALAKEYMALIKNPTLLGYSMISEDKQTRASVEIVVTGESEGAEVQLAPYFHTCGNDCIRQRGTVVLCPEKSAVSPPDSSRSTLGVWLSVLLPVLLVVTWMLILGIYLTWRHERARNSSLSATRLLPPLKILVVYPSEICFHHTVCYFADFIQNQCRSEIILEKWQKKKIAEMGPVQWLTTQKKASDKVIFLLSNDAKVGCDGTCDKGKGGSGEASQDLFPLAFNLFCSDLRSQARRHKYMVVYFREVDAKEDYHALSVCPKYHLMKDATAFRTELLRVKPRVSMGKKLGARHSSYSFC
ncbi:interleukin-17 receptor B [Sorex araneus]|uniref:interleukin-17 receptor B n=1 Tax=Sorex araneus TaxID=42254 RepID=UPI0024336883|nr:interleukin-17 receptor B [Sorex araneus]